MNGDDDSRRQLNVNGKESQRRSDVRRPSVRPSVRLFVRSFGSLGCGRTNGLVLPVETSWRRRLVLVVVRRYCPLTTSWQKESINGETECISE